MAKSSSGILDSGTGSLPGHRKPTVTAVYSSSSRCCCLSNGGSFRMVRNMPEESYATVPVAKSGTKPRPSRQQSTSPCLSTSRLDASMRLDPQDFNLASPTRHARSRTVSLPLQGSMDHKPNCHCPACCACPDRLSMPSRNCSHHRSVHLNTTISVSSLPFSSSCSDHSASCTSPTPIQSWTHYNRPSDNRYKYRRSDYSSDSDEEMTSDPVEIVAATASCPTFTFDRPESESSSYLPMDDNHPHPASRPYHSHYPLGTAFSDLIDKIDNDAVVSVAANRTGSLDGDEDTSQDSVFLKEGISPYMFKDRFGAIVKWFSEFDDEQKNIVLKRLLMDCSLPQFHLLSVKMEANLHRGCPPNCQDIITWLPDNLATKVFSYLDPVSLCQASQVCLDWKKLGGELSLWRRFCFQPKWRLSKAAEHKQVISHMSPEGSIQWKLVFAERFRLRNNWLKGRCTVRTFEGHTQGISCVQFDDTRIVSGSSDKTIKVWNIRTNAPWSVQTLVGHSGTVRCLHLEGNRLVSGSTDRTIKVWDLSTRDSWSSIACKVTMIGHTDTVRCLQVDDDKVISGSYDKTLKIWDMRTGVCKLSLRGHQAAVLCIHFNETKIVSGSCDKTIKVWNFAGQCMMTLTGHQDAVTCLQFDSTRIVSGSLDCNLKFWDIHTGHCINTIDWKAAEGHTGVVRCLQADSWRLVSAADDKTLKVWNLETGQRLVTLRNHTDGVTCLQFNDFLIVSGSYDKTVKLWDFSSC
ncbi:F-box/WD repeat-containing protein 7-like [Liolophura sinensis]|uniref:F-box/WD repeat-containing protein 7-like n=1 Tax=Liolophura sinensis TaxID=3198878 RepID=UPI003158B662